MSEYVNLPPGATVPKSGEYKCIFCGEGGLADFMANGLKDAGFGPLTGQLQGLGKQKSQRYFEKGRKFPECPNCGKGTGWSLVDEASLAEETTPRKHDEVVADSGVCDICDKQVNSPDGYLLTSKEVVSSPAYWQHYFQIHSGEFSSMGISSYAQFCRNSLVRNNTGEAIAGQKTPWMVCESCIVKFSVDRARARGYAKQWWNSGKKFQPPGTGPSSISAVNMGDGKVMFSTTDMAVSPVGKQPTTATVPSTSRKKWWQFWK